MITLRDIKKCRIAICDTKLFASHNENIIYFWIVVYV